MATAGRLIAGKSGKELFSDSEILQLPIGKKYALKKYDQFALNTSCFWRSTISNITSVVQFHEIFVTKLMNKLIIIYYYC